MRVAPAAVRTEAGSRLRLTPVAPTLQLFSEGLPSAPAWKQRAEGTSSGDEGGPSELGNEEANLVQGQGSLKWGTGFDNLRQQVAPPRTLGTPSAAQGAAARPSRAVGGRRRRPDTASRAPGLQSKARFPPRPLGALSPTSWPAHRGPFPYRLLVPHRPHDSHTPRVPSALLL